MSVEPYREITVLGGRSFRVVPSAHAHFWRSMANGEWEPGTLQALSALVRPDTTFVDVGAWIGPTTLFASCTARRCIAFEPDPNARVELSANIAANSLEDRVTIVPACVAAREGTTRMANRWGTADSAASMLYGNSETGWEARVVRLEKILRELDVTGHVVIKMDIEGAEYELLPALGSVAKLYRPDLLFSLHPGLYCEHLLGTRLRRLGYIGRAVRKLRYIAASYRALRGAAAFGRLSKVDGTPMDARMWGELLVYSKDFHRDELVCLASPRALR